MSDDVKRIVAVEVLRAVKETAVPRIRNLVAESVEMGAPWPDSLANMITIRTRNGPRLFEVRVTEKL